MVRQVDNGKYKFLTEALEILKRQDNEQLVNEKIVRVSKAWEYIIKK